MRNIIFIHGLESSGKGFKGTMFKEKLPNCLTPDFTGDLEQRMEQLEKILDEKEKWVLIGSSFGGLMSALYASQFPEKVSFMILLAPLLVHPKLKPGKRPLVHSPVVVYHGNNDKVIPLQQSRTQAEKIFSYLIYKVVDDDHKLHSTVKEIDWRGIIY